MSFLNGQMPWQPLNDVFGVGGAVQGAASIANGVMSYNAATHAADLQSQAAANALGFQKDVYGNEQTQIAPYLASGQQNLNTLNAQMPQLTAAFDPTQQGLQKQFNPADYGLAQTFSYGAKDFQVDPGFQFALQQGQQALQRSAASKAGVLSGAAQKELAAYTTGQAEQGYGQAYQRAQGTYQQNYGNAANQYQQNYGNAFNTYNTGQANAFNRLNTLAGQGLSATGVANQAGQQFAQGAGNAAIQAGNAQAAGIVGGANGLASGITGAANALSTGYGMQNTYNPNTAIAQYNSGYAPLQGGYLPPGSADGFGGTTP